MWEQPCPRLIYSFSFPVTQPEAWSSLGRDGNRAQHHPHPRQSPPPGRPSSELWQGHDSEPHPTFLSMAAPGTTADLALTSRPPQAPASLGSQSQGSAPSRGGSPLPRSWNHEAPERV